MTRHYSSNVEGSNSWDFEGPRLRLVRVMSEKGIEVFDPTDLFRSETADPWEIYLKDPVAPFDEGHFTARASRLVAKELGSRIFSSDLGP